MKDCSSDMPGLVCFGYGLLIFVNISGISIFEKRKLRFGMIAERVTGRLGFQGGCKGIKGQAL